MDKPRYWFPAKTYGWGWGLPSTWEGWMVMVAYIAAMAAGGLYLLPRYGQGVFLAYTFVLAAALLAICRAKGEPPEWRWGKKQ